MTFRTLALATLALAATLGAPGAPVSAQPGQPDAAAAPQAAEAAAQAAAKAAAHAADKAEPLASNERLAHRPRALFKSVETDTD